MISECSITWTQFHSTGLETLQIRTQGSCTEVQVQYYTVFHLTGPGQKVISIKNPYQKNESAS